MIILGIDPGLRTTGFGVIEKHGNKLRYIASGTVKTGSEGELPPRLKIILQGVSEIVGTYQPDCAAIEKVFVNVNPQSTLLLGQARGAAICALVHADLSVAEYTALQVKQAVTGHGKAAKEQVQEMVSRLLSLARLARHGCGRCAGRGHLPRQQHRCAGHARRAGAPAAGLAHEARPFSGVSAWPSTIYTTLGTRDDRPSLRYFA